MLCLTLFCAESDRAREVHFVCQIRTLSGKCSQQFPLRLNWDSSLRMHKLFNVVSLYTACAGAVDGWAAVLSKGLWQRVFPMQTHQ